MEQDTTPRPQTETPAAPVQQKPRKKRRVVVLVLLLLVALAAAGVFGWLWYQQTGRIDELENKVQAREQEVKRLYAVNSAVKQEQSSDMSDDENAAIIKAALAAARAPREAAGMNYEATIKYNKDGFARTAIRSDDAAGFAQVLKLVDDQWVVIIAGQTKPSQDEVTEYGIPQGLLDTY